ncbi:sucrose-phosphatase 2-like [Iris pallida]|uniref:Sucrose-phosphatase 2-like n=1 Tax=Iris pallida TaxID=29817 RepID=A0AAX6GR57_IRIPA|nr:sucrose-phosphatase 2-like [Iris pallida]
MHQSAIVVHPSGLERSLHGCIDAFGQCYGDKQGKDFQVWMDRVSSSQIGSDDWLVKFDKCEMSGWRVNFLWLWI